MVYVIAVSCYSLFLTLLLFYLCMAIMNFLSTKGQLCIFPVDAVWEIRPSLRMCVCVFIFVCSYNGKPQCKKRTLYQYNWIYQLVMLIFCRAHSSSNGFAASQPLVILCCFSVLLFWSISVRIYNADLYSSTYFNDCGQTFVVFFTNE